MSSDANGTRTYEVQTFLSIRREPGLAAERLSRFLNTGARITVDAGSRTEKDGFIWWQHDAGWSAEGKIDGSSSYMKLVATSQPEVEDGGTPENGTTPDATQPDSTTPETSGGGSDSDSSTTAAPPVTGETQKFKVLTNLSIRVSPSLSAERTEESQLLAGRVITVQSDSRTEAEGYVWWQHDAGWSAERNLSGTTVFLGDPATPVPGAIPLDDAGLPIVDQLPEANKLIQRLPVAHDQVQWVQYFGNTQFAFQNGRRWSYHTFAQGLHSGLDLGNNSPSGIPVYAGVHGNFLRNNRYGLAVKSGDYVIIYQHLYKNTTFVAGGPVTPDTVLGEMTPRDVHLHLEIRLSAEKWIVNPLLLMPEAMRQGIMDKFPTFARHFQPYDRWQTPVDQPVIVRGGPVIGPTAG